MDWLFGFFFDGPSEGLGCLTYLPLQEPCGLWGQEFIRVEGQGHSAVIGFMKYRIRINSENLPF